MSFETTIRIEVQSRVGGISKYLAGHFFYHTWIAMEKDLDWTRLTLSRLSPLRQRKRRVMAEITEFFNQSKVSLSQLYFIFLTLLQNTQIHFLQTGLATDIPSPKL